MKQRIAIIFVLIISSAVFAGDVIKATAAGEVTWTIQYDYIKEASLIRGDNISHTDAFDDVFKRSSTTSSGVSINSNFKYSSTYALVVKELTLYNSSAGTGSVDCYSNGNLGSDNATTWHYKANSTGPYYSISSDQALSDVNAGDPVVSFLFGDESAYQYGKYFSTSNGDDDFYFRLSDIELAAYETGKLLYLSGLGDIDDGDFNRPDKALEVVTLLCEPENWPRDILDQFAAEDFQQVLNWDMSGVTVAPVISSDSILLEGPTALCSGSVASSVSYTYGLEYSSNQGFEPGAGTTVPGEEFSSDDFIIEMNGLTLGTRYYYRCYATNIFGTTWSDEASFVADYSTPLIGEIPVSVSADAVYADRLDLSWEMGTGDYYAVFMKNSDSGLPEPADNSTYNASAIFGDGATAGTGWYCVYNGSEEQTVVSGLEQNSQYRVMAVSYNGTEGYEKYLVEESAQNPLNVMTNTTPSPSEEPTPVSLTLFTALYDAGQVIIDWETESEVNNLGFVLYRNGVILASYLTCADLIGCGFSSENRSYRLTDTQVVNGKVYHYELSDVDRSGKETLRADAEVAIPVQNILVTENGTLSSAYPNPFNAIFTVPLELYAPQRVRIELYNLKGKQVMTVMNDNMEAGSYTFRVDVQSLSSGVYFLETFLEDAVSVQKMILSK